MKKILFISFIILWHFAATAQNEAAQWALAHGRLDFRQTPVAYHSVPTASIAVDNVSICDRNGNLQFYGNSLYLFNRDGLLMPEFRDVNNTPTNFLLGNRYSGLDGQAAVTIPWPGRDSLYFLFYWESGFLVSSYQGLLRYAIVNMNRDGGRGDVVTRDVLLLNGQKICDKITVAQHCNKKDFWLVGHYTNSDNYFSLAVTQAGISNTPVLSTGNFISAPVNMYNMNSSGPVTISPLGDKIVCGFRGIYQFTELGDFNSSTGQVGNIIKLFSKPAWALPVSYEGNYGAEFSASGKYLYLSDIYDVQWPCCVYPSGHLWQFDLSVNNQAAIQNSRVLIDSVMIQKLFGLQLAIDGKIYVNNERYNLSIIHNPEGAGTACNFQRDAIHSPSDLHGKNFPDFPGSFFRNPVLVNSNCQSQSMSFSVQNTVGVASADWDFGDPASGAANNASSFTPTHLFSQPGAYRVRIVFTPTNGCANDTVYKTVHAGELKVFLGNDTAVCQRDTLILKPSTPVPFASYQWSNGSTDSAIKVTQGSLYWVKLTVGGCSATDSINITVRNLPQFSLGNDTIICGNQSYTLQPQPGYLGAVYLWNTGAATPAVQTTSPGLYWLRLTDSYGCRYRDSINVSFRTLPSFNLGNDTSLCAGQTLPLRANITAGGYLWNTGAVSQQINVTATGWYWCDASLNGCSYRDSIYVLFKPLPNIYLGVDTTLCEGIPYTLNAANPGATYLWQDGATSATYTVTQPGIYKVKVTVNGCDRSDTVNIGYNYKPLVDLGPDLSYCPGMQISLRPDISYAQNILWQNGSTGPVLIATQPGLYSVKVINDCGEQSDSIQIDKGICKVYVPSAFTPNNDGVNDIFKVQFGEGIVQFEMTIFNRWGQKVFYTTDKLKGWNGQVNGKWTTGAYAWIIKFREATGDSQKIMKGTVLVIR